MDEQELNSAANLLINSMLSTDAASLSRIDTKDRLYL